MELGEKLRTTPAVVWAYCSGRPASLAWLSGAAWGGRSRVESSGRVTDDWIVAQGRSTGTSHTAVEEMRQHSTQHFTILL